MDTKGLEKLLLHLKSDTCMYSRQELIIDYKCKENNFLGLPYRQAVMKMNY